MAMISILLALAAVQQPGPSGVPLPPPPDQSSISVRPGETPQGVRPIPISETAEPVGLAFASFDADHDGSTSRAELEAALTRTFTAADTNGDGQLGYIEYSNWAQTWLGSPTALPGPYAIDANGDDRLSRDEFIEAFRRDFARFDRNGDGLVSHAELLTVRHPRMAPPPRPDQQQQQDPRRRGRR